MKNKSKEEKSIWTDGLIWLKKSLYSTQHTGIKCHFIHITWKKQVSKNDYFIALNILFYLCYVHNRNVVAQKEMNTIDDNSGKKAMCIQ